MKILHNLNKFGKFCIVGLLAFIINMILLILFTEVFKIYYMLSAILAYEISIIGNFLMNDNWTFKEIGKHNSFSARIINFNITRASGAIISIFLLYILTEFLSMNYISSNIISIMTGTLWSYTTSVTMVWRN